MAIARGSCCMFRYGEQVILSERNPQYRNNDKRKHEFEFPGGKCYDDESYEVAAIREVLEETGLILDISQLKCKTVIHGDTDGVIRCGTCLFVADLTDEQYNGIPKLIAVMRQQYQTDPASVEAMNLKSFPIKNVIQAITDDKALNGLGLRAYNKFLLKQLVQTYPL